MSTRIVPGVFLVGALVPAVLMIGHYQKAPGQGAAADDVFLAAVAERIIEQTNQFRKEQDLKPVTSESHLDETATDFAKFMAETKKYGHEADGKTPWDRAIAHRYDACITLENIAYQFKSSGFAKEELATAFVEGWNESPGHRKNMLNADISQTGVAVAKSEDGTYYAVQMFGRPKADAILFKVSNQTGEDLKYSVDDKEHTLPPNYTMTHQTCTTPKLVFHEASEKAAEETQAEKPMQPSNKTSYVVRKDSSGTLTIDVQKDS